MIAPVVVLGDLMTDVVTRADGPIAVGSDSPASVRLLGGGSGANVAAWLGALGHPVTYVGRVGDDALGRIAVSELHDVGVTTSIGVDHELPTGTCVVLVDHDGERSMLPDPGANITLQPTHLPREAFTRGAHLHLSGYTLLHPGARAAGLAALALARDAGMTVSVDPASSAPIRAIGVEQVLTWMAGVDLLLPNDDELHVLGGRVRAHEAARADRIQVARELAARLDALVVATCGAAGALAVWPDGAVHQVDAEPVAVADLTGCGDAFAAGFLHAWLGGPESAAGERCVVALAAGASSAARCDMTVGGRPVPGAGTG